MAIQLVAVGHSARSGIASNADSTGTRAPKAAPSDAAKNGHCPAIQNEGDNRHQNALKERLDRKFGRRQPREAGSVECQIYRQVDHQRSRRNKCRRVKWFKSRLPHRHGEARGQERREEKEGVAEGLRNTPGRTPPVPADNDSSTSQYQRQPHFSSGRKLLLQNHCNDECDEQWHAARVERAVLVGGCELQPTGRYQRIRRAVPGNDHGQSQPTQAIKGETSPYEHR